jgi:basic membrane protein A
MKHYIAHILRCFVLFAFVVASTACSSVATPSSSVATPTTESIRVALVLSGSAADGGWGSAGVEGLRKLRDLHGAEIDYTEVSAYTGAEELPDDWAQAFKKYAEDGYDIIFAHGRWFDGLIAEISPNYPDVRFVVTGGNGSGPNYASVTLKNEEAGYLLGIIAGMLTKNGKIGVVVGTQLRPVMSTAEAFADGVKAINPNIELYQRVLEDQGPDNPDKHLNNQDGANDVTQELVDEGVDLLFLHATAANIGAIKIAKEHNIPVLNYGKDLTNIAPGIVIANGLQIIPATMEVMLKNYKENSFENKNYLMGLKEGAVDLSPLSVEYIPSDIQEKVKEVEQGLIDGTIKLESQR